jgi:hypothetical protein
VRKPPLVERAEAAGLVCPAELGRLAHVLATERGRTRAGTTLPALAPWIASALPPGVPLFVAGGDPLLDDPDVHPVDSLEPEAPFDLVAVDGGDVAGLLVPGGIALVAGRTVEESGLASVELPGGLAIAVRYRL